jgi:hypothetical protein
MPCSVAENHAASILVRRVSSNVTIYLLIYEALRPFWSKAMCCDIWTPLVSLPAAYSHTFTSWPTWIQLEETSIFTSTFSHTLRAARRCIFLNNSARSSSSQNTASYWVTNIKFFIVHLQQTESCVWYCFLYSDVDIFLRITQNNCRWRCRAPPCPVHDVAKALMKTLPNNGDLMTRMWPQETCITVLLRNWRLTYLMICMETIKRTSSFCFELHTTNHKARITSRSSGLWRGAVVL